MLIFLIGNLLSVGLGALIVFVCLRGLPGRDRRPEAAEPMADPLVEQLENLLSYNGTEEGQREVKKIDD